MHNIVKEKAFLMKIQFTTKKICFIAVFLALTVILSSSIFSIPVPGGHLYMNDIIICLAALVLDPISAFIVGGVGAFLGDAIFYPTPMFVSLVTHGLQAVAISLIAGAGKYEKPNIVRAIVALIAGVLIMVGGYTIGRAFIYSTPETALLKLPFQFLQAITGAVVAAVLVYATPIVRLIKPKEKKNAEPEHSEVPASEEKNV